MRFFVSLLTSLVLASVALAQDGDVRKEKYEYQSDVSRLRKIVVNSLYSHRDVFLRELISNSNDALEKLRLTALTDKTVYDGVSPLNITVKAEKDESGGRIILTDTGIGMSPEELTKNLGTLAKSGTSEFLSQAESTDATGTGNLIGAFGLGFYSSFLVADRVFVASIPPPTTANPNPTQHVFSSSSEDSSFEIYPDPRGNTLGRGTEITLVLNKDAIEYLENKKLEEVINKHSGFTTFPIYLHTERIEEVPEATEEAPAKSIDDDEVVVEDVSETEPPKTKSIKVEEWKHINSQPPLWLRDSKDVTDEQYMDFYKVTFKDTRDPIAWEHFSGESNSVDFKALIYIPSQLDDQFWQQGATTGPDTRLLVKRVLITNDLGEDGMPKWASWVKVIIDADDLPLNVSRETLQSTKFLKTLKHIILKRIIKIFGEIADEDPAKYKDIWEAYGTALKLGGVEDYVYKAKLAGLARFNTNQRDFVSLNEYVENKKVGQKHIFFLADAGKTKEVLAKSVFVEKLHARGYEVLLLGEPLDEIFLGQLTKGWKGLTWQDSAKAGLKFGDEDDDTEREKEEQAIFQEKYQVLLDWLKAEAKGIVRDVVMSNRLVTSPCAIVADQMGYTANIQKLMNAANNQKQGVMNELAKKQIVLEINPKAPLIEGLLRRVERLPGEDEEPDLEALEELKEVASILIDGALVRSGFEVPDSNVFFERVDRVLRRSLGVSEEAPTDATVRPAPPVDPEMPEEVTLPPLEEGQIPFELPEELKDDFSLVMEPIPEDEYQGYVSAAKHDEL